MPGRIASAACLLLWLCLHALAQAQAARTLSGGVLTAQNEAVEGVTVLVRSASGEQKVLTDAEGRFRATVPLEPLSLKFFGRNIALVSRSVASGESAEGLRIRVAFLVPPVHESVVIEGSDVVDLGLRKRVRSWLDFNLSADNLTNKRYFETQNYFESRLRPGGAAVARVHGTPGYPFGLTAGLTFRLFGKD